MKKAVYAVLCIIISITVVYFGYTNINNNSIKTYYNVYLRGELIGTINSEQEFFEYVDQKEMEYKKIYSVDTINAPQNLDIQKLITYQTNTDSVVDIYNKISEKSNFTISGYQINIANDNKQITLYIIDHEILEKAISNIIEMYVGKENYENYKNDNQEEIKTTGNYINNVYIDNDITIKKYDIPVNEKIYTSSEELTKFFLYGNQGYEKKYIAAIGDTVDSISYKNKISIEEFMIANPNFNNSQSLLYPGQEIKIGLTDPQIQVTVEQTVTEDTPFQYKTIETVDETRLIGDDVIVQQGENGMLRVSRNEKIVNGINTYTQPLTQELLKPSIDKIIIKGGKKVSGVGTFKDLAWPTESGWNISSGYFYRIHPVTFVREFHDAVDIAGTGYGSEIYAIDNGVIELKRDIGSCGNAIEINHNNGYYSLYCHLSRFGKISVGQAVEKGQVIGYVGMTGRATGPHLHFAIWKGGKPWASGASALNPLDFYK